MTNNKKVNKTNLPRKLNSREFIKEYIKRQKELMAGMAACIHNGEIELDTTYADDLVESIVEEWCNYQEPTVSLHMKMNAAVFLWALLDKIEGFDDEAKNDNAEEIDAAKVSNDVVTVTVEILKTVRSIWGKV